MSSFLLPSSLLRAALALLALGLSGCAALDPHDVLGRRVAHLDPPADGTPIALGEAGRRRAIDHVWAVVSERYYDPSLNGVDWAAARRRWEPVALQAATDEAFWQALDRMTGELRDAHTRVESPARAALRERSESVSVGFGARWLEGRLVVTSVRADSGAFLAGVRPGMTIVEVDGEAASAAFAQWLSQARLTSTDGARERVALRSLLAGEPDSRARLVFERAGGERLEATIPRERHRSPPRVTHRTLPSGFGYVRLSNWNASLQGEMIAAITALKESPGLVIDLRGNPGGALTMVQAVTAHLVEGRLDAGRALTRTGKPITIAFDWVELIKLRQEIEGKGTYRGPIVILVNGESASASEFFSGVLQASKRATVIGETTCGCLLAYLGYANVPGGGRLAYSEVGFELPSGRRIEREGVVPDITVPTTIADLQANRDRALEAAQRVLAGLHGRAARAAVGR